jgi:microsomal prostaglandin-E synthase 2
MRIHEHGIEMSHIFSFFILRSRDVPAPRQTRLALVARRASRSEYLANRFGHDAIGLAPFAPVTLRDAPRPSRRTMRAAALALGRRAAGAAGAAGAGAFPARAGRALAPALAPLAQPATASSGFATSAVARARAALAPRAPAFGASLAVASCAIATTAVAAGVAAEPARAKEAVPIASLPFQKVTLYQYDVCPFCNKVKAMLDFHGVPYDVVEVNPLTKSEMKFSKEYRKVPVLVVDDAQINNSGDIMRWLEDNVPSAIALRKRNGTSRDGSLAKEKEAKWMAWVDDRFVHVVTPNIYRTWQEAFNSFDYITERGNFNFFERQAVRVSGAVSMYLIAHNVLKKRHGIEDERLELYKDLETWTTEAVGDKAPFCGGNNPNLADLAVFGVMRAVKTFETFDDAMRASPRTQAWYKRMEKEVGAASRSDGIEN